MLWTIAVLCAGRDKRSSHYIDCMYCELWVRCGAGDYNLESPSSRRREHLHTSSAWMVFGPILDALAARERGVSVVQVLSEGNRLVAARLSFQAKLVFWLTNVPYWALAVELCTGAPPLVAGPRGAHALAAIIVATASTIFHGSVLFGPVNSAWPPRLLRADIICANGYGACLSLLVGLPFALRQFGLPLLFLAGAAKSKRSGYIAIYAWCHGIWHILSCFAIWRCLYHSV